MVISLLDLVISPDSHVISPVVSQPSSKSTKVGLLAELVAPPVRAGRYVPDAALDSPGLPLPTMPTVKAARVKSAGVPAVMPKAKSDPSTGRYEDVPGESSRQRQWRLFGVWRARGGQRQDEFKRRRW